MVAGKCSEISVIAVASGVIDCPVVSKVTLCKDVGDQNMMLGCAKQQPAHCRNDARHTEM